ncbi:restriction endonuclease [Wenyingzhuangia sp. 2_MG-2023]|uniref:restriction endonuclease n=1 Tax=Wenyingzhuangia sp. 2_MG-2023 TaxID=3062639 RepID=UPI0026E330CD|nr:restriction endonuclease [Wenyingzhuangia sp. 2_MG-2023]MDO6739455.1 restriction endonuclease [Wenyingzhuangia sp. 2_MG-2023]
MSIEDKTWRKYERQIHQELTSVFTDCEFEFDDRIFGKHSRIDRQIDISIRGNIGGNKILGIIDCKHFSKNIDIKIIESFLGMLEDTKANFGLIITNKGFSSSAKNRANVRNLRLDIIEFDELEKIKLTFDYFVNQKIRNLELSKYEFFKRAKQNSGYFDLSKSDYNKRIITFKEGFANTEYYAFKKIIKESARLFRDFTDLEILTIRIPANKENKKQLYYSKVNRNELEKFLKLDFRYLREDIKFWRSDFLENGDYTKESVYDFANENINSTEYTNYENEI